MSCDKIDNCDQSLGDCRPSRCCPETPDPVMPRCDNYIPDGRFTNATAIVEGGCVIAFEQGTPFQYSPDTSCQAGTGAGRMLKTSTPEPSLARQAVALMAPNSQPEGTTVEVGSVHAIEPDGMPRVVNVGTATKVVLDFYLPRFDPEAPELQALTSESGGWAIKDGRIHYLPTTFPPIGMIVADPDSQVLVEVDKDPDTGVATMKLDVSHVVDAAVREAMREPLQALENMRAQIADLMDQLSALREGE